MAEENDTRIIGLLRGVAKRICQIIGEEAAMRLFDELGGVTLSLPIVNFDGNPTFERLAEIVGRTEAHRICEAFPPRLIEKRGKITRDCRSLYVPRISNAIGVAKANWIRARFAELMKSNGKMNALSLLCEEVGISTASLTRFVDLIGVNEFDVQPSRSIARDRQGIAMDEAVCADLPPAASEILDAVGAEAAERLLRNFGGQPISIPVSMAANRSERLGRIKAAIGDEKYRDLIDRFGGTDLYIPSLKPAIEKMRNRTICRDFEGMLKTMSATESVAVLAHRHEVSDRQVWRILKGNQTVERMPAKNRKHSDSYSSAARRVRNEKLLEVFDSQSKKMNMSERVDEIAKRFILSVQRVYRVLESERGVTRPLSSYEKRKIEGEQAREQAEKNALLETKREQTERLVRATFRRYRETLSPMAALSRVCGDYKLNEQDAQRILKHEGIKSLVKKVKGQSFPEKNATASASSAENIGDPASAQQPRKHSSLDDDDSDDGESDGSRSEGKKAREAREFAFVSSAVRGLGWARR